MYAPTPARSGLEPCFSYPSATSCTDSGLVSLQRYAHRDKLPPLMPLFSLPGRLATRASSFPPLSSETAPACRKQTHLIVQPAFLAIIITIPGFTPEIPSTS